MTDRRCCPEFTCSNRHCYVFRVVPETELVLIYSCAHEVLLELGRVGDYYHMHNKIQFLNLSRVKERKKRDTKRSILFLVLGSIAFYLFKLFELYEI